MDTEYRQIESIQEFQIFWRNSFPVMQWDDCIREQLFAVKQYAGLLVLVGNLKKAVEYAQG